MAGGQLFPAHRAVLDCRSLVLASLLDRLDGTSEDHPAAEVPVLQLQHLTARAAKPFLRYVYAGVVPSGLEDTALATDLHCAALCYNVRIEFTVHSKCTCKSIFFAWKLAVYCAHKIFVQICTKFVEISAIFCLKLYEKFRVHQKLRAFVRNS